jgi:thiol-disulfide isomerase/thioredoxin
VNTTTLQSKPNHDPSRKELLINQALKPLVLVLLMLITACSQSASETEENKRLAAPDLVLQDLAGNTHRIEQYRGQVLLINFWATWCPPCRAEMPSLWRLRKKIGANDFQIVAINMGEDKALITAFMPRSMLEDFIVLQDRKSALLEPWRVTAFPASYLIDRQGRIASTYYGALDWDQPQMVGRIEGLLAEGSRDREP